MKTIINLYNNANLIATSTVSFNPVDLIKYYFEVMDNPFEYDLQIKFEKPFDMFFEDWTFKVGGYGFESEWSVLEDDQWLYEGKSKEDVLEYLTYSINRIVEMENERREWA